MTSETTVAPSDAAYPIPVTTGPLRNRGGLRRQIKPGERLFHEGDECPRIFVVESGWLKLTRTLSDGSRQIVGFPTRHSILGIESPLESLNDCETLTEAVVHSFPVSTIVQLCREPRFTEALLQQVGAQLGAAQAQLASVGAQSAAQKMATFLTSIADACAAGTGEFTLPMRRGDIGDFLGLRLETVSRTFSAFRQRGWLSMSALYRCRITNNRALAALASGARTMKSFPLPGGVIKRTRTCTARRPRV